MWKLIPSLDGRSCGGPGWQEGKEGSGVFCKYLKHRQLAEERSAGGQAGRARSLDAGRQRYRGLDQSWEQLSGRGAAEDGRKPRAASRRAPGAEPGRSDFVLKAARKHEGEGDPQALGSESSSDWDAESRLSRQA